MGTGASLWISRKTLAAFLRPTQLSRVSDAVRAAAGPVPRVPAAARCSAAAPMEKPLGQPGSPGVASRPRAAKGTTKRSLRQVFLQRKRGKRARVQPGPSAGDVPPALGVFSLSCGPGRLSIGTLAKRQRCWQAPGSPLAFPEQNKAGPSPGSPGGQGARSPTAHRSTGRRKRFQGGDGESFLVKRRRLSPRQPSRGRVLGAACPPSSVPWVQGASARVPPCRDGGGLQRPRRQRRALATEMDGAKAISRPGSRWRSRLCLQPDPGGLKSARICRHRQNPVHRIKHELIS